MSVDQTGNKEETFQVEDFSALRVILADPGDPFPGNSHIRGIDLSRENIDDPGASQEKVSRPVPFGNCRLNFP